jgi:hypothetical protein
MSAMHKQDSPAPTLEHIMSAIAGAEASRDELREMIAAAFAEARRDGVEQMREACAKACGETYTLEITHGDKAVEIEALRYPAGMTADAIRAMPLPTGPRQVVRLADEEIAELAVHAVKGSPDAPAYLSVSKAIERAVLAANGLETK